MSKKLLKIIGVLSFVLFAQTTGAFTTVPTDYSNGATGRLAVHITDADNEYHDYCGHAQNACGNQSGDIPYGEYDFEAHTTDWKPHTG